MEELYTPESFGASIQFPLKRYFEEFSNTLSTHISFPANTNNECDKNKMQYLQEIRRRMGMDVDFKQLKQLSQACSIDLLTCEEENTKDFPLDVPCNLKSNSKVPSTIINSQREILLEVNKSKRNLEQKQDDLVSLRMKRRYLQTLEFSKPSLPPDLSPSSDFIVSVLIYRPFAFKYFCAKNASENLKFNHEIVALGSNTLAELRDTIICSSDDGLCKEVQNTIDDLRPLADAKSEYPSGFIFIDDTFYNDFRASNAIDYSLPILEWAKEKKIKNLQSSSMEGVRIDSLTPRFGYPYLYVHQGDCEHLLVFSDAKLLNHDDCLHSQCYPHVLKLHRKINRLCFLCTVSLAQWICVGSDRFPQKKVFLCTDCCNAYNYINGEKIGNFELYPYYEKYVVTEAQ